MKNRKTNRRVDFDYNQTGYYFITINTFQKKSFLGHLSKDKIILNKMGIIAKEHWLKIPIHFENILLDEFIIMPNHIHGIISIVGNGFSRSSVETRQHQLIPKIINRFKGGVSRQIIKERLKPFPTEFGWQKSYYDHVIRNNKSLHKLREYILNNQLKITSI